MFGFTTKKISVVDSGTSEISTEENVVRAGKLFMELLKLGIAEKGHAKNAALEAFNRFVKVHETIPFADKKQIDEIYIECEVSFDEL